jgi:hypothetical protein
MAILRFYLMVFSMERALVLLIDGGFKTNGHATFPANSQLGSVTGM